MSPAPDLAGSGASHIQSAHEACGCTGPVWGVPQTSAEVFLRSAPGRQYRDTSRCHGLSRGRGLRCVGAGGRPDTLKKRNKNGTQRRGNRRPLSGRRGCEARLRLSRRRRSLYLRRALCSLEARAHPRAPRAGRRPRGRRLRTYHPGGRRLPRHLRSRPDQRGHRHRHGLHGLHPAGGHQRPGAFQCHRPGCLPGMRLGGHHPALRQAQFPGQGRARPGHHHQEGLSHRPYRPARSGADRHSQGRVARPLRFLLSQDGVDALLQPGGQGPPGPAQEGAAAAAVGRAADGLCGRWCRAGQCCEAADRTGRSPGISMHHHADGAGRLSGQRRQMAGHARYAWHLRGQHGHAAL